MSDLESFRKETRDWLEKNCPPEMRQPMLVESDTFWGGRNPSFQSEAQRVWFERVRDKKWVVPHWPAEYGGGGLDPAQAKIVREEMAAIGARPALRSFGIMMLGPALLKFGTEEQKREHLPKICSGEIRWCQGYSEPNSGSDLASLQTRADLDGDHYVVNGQKIWTSYANKADWIFCLTRTDFSAKKHEGISFLLFDMRTAGRHHQADPPDLRLLAVLRNLLRQCPRTEEERLGHRQQGLGRRQVRVAVRARLDQRHRRPGLKTLDERDRDLDGWGRQGRQARRIRCCARVWRSSRSMKSPLRSPPSAPPTRSRSARPIRRSPQP